MGDFEIVSEDQAARVKAMTGGRGRVHPVSRALVRGQMVLLDRAAAAKFLSGARNPTSYVSRHGLKVRQRLTPEGVYLWAIDPAEEENDEA